MLAVISPAKTLDYESAPVTTQFSQPQLLDQSARLVSRLGEMAPHELSALMSISDKLGVLNHERYQQWVMPFTPENARQALLAFKGDVYTGLNVDSFTEQDFSFAQQHLCILSGLYGVLRPLDLMQPYRLEMGTRLAMGARLEKGAGTEKGAHRGRGNEHSANLYQFWGDTITHYLNESLSTSGSQVLINLASNEYFKSVKPALLQGEVITPVFKEYRNGSYKVISFLAKKARGAMTAYLIRNRLETPAQLKDFTEDGYAFNPQLSDVKQWVFTRKP
jgi:cytoplasmic iron level regulating protein YaaA (DUF328/UPF0246 family)